MVHCWEIEELANLKNNKYVTICHWLDYTTETESYLMLWVYTHIQNTLNSQFPAAVLSSPLCWMRFSSVFKAVPTSKQQAFPPRGLRRTSQLWSVSSIIWENLTNNKPSPVLRVFAAVIFVWKLPAPPWLLVAAASAEHSDDKNNKMHLRSNVTLYEGPRGLLYVPQWKSLLYFS